MVSEGCLISRQKNKYAQLLYSIHFSKPNASTHVWSLIGRKRIHLLELWLHIFFGRKPNELVSNWGIPKMDQECDRDDTLWIQVPS